MERHAIALCLVALACGCAAPGATTDVPAPAQPGQQGPSLLGQTQLPPGSRMRTEESLVMGTGDDWLGRLVLETGQDSTGAYQFFLESYPRQGWTLLTATRAKTSLLVFTKQERTATIEVAEGAGFSRGALVTLTVTLKGVAAPPLKKP